MALVVSKSHSSQAVADLAEALRNFEDMLSDRQKQEFRSAGPPSATAAIDLATQIDSECIETRKHCMGPRFIPFFQCVQKCFRLFCDELQPAADTFVSSHPERAALVWGGLKVVLLVANNIATKFDKISELFMRIGQQCRTMQALGSLYPSEGLNNARCEFLTAVVQLSQDVLKYLAKPKLQQWSSAILNPFHVEFGHYEQDFARLTQAIRDQAFLALSECQKSEAELQKIERSSMTKFRRKVGMLNEEFEEKHLRLQKWRMEDNKQQFLNMLSTHDFETPFRRIWRERTPNTCEWIYQQDEFTNWTNTSSSIFCISGKLGSGKSVISSSVIMHLLESRTSDDVISYFFCRFDHETSLEADTLICCLLRQMTSSLPAEEFQRFGLDLQSKAKAIKYAKQILRRNQRYFIILDGIDDLRRNQEIQVHDFLQELLLDRNISVKVLVTDRPSTQDRTQGWIQEKKIKRFLFNLESPEGRRQVDLDIATFIVQNLESLLSEEKPDFLGQPKLIVHIRDVLKKKAKGMMLWVKLQLESIAEKRTDNEILIALDQLPRDLPETFERLLKQSADKDATANRKRTFSWLAVAKRPLLLLELREAISIELLQKFWNSSTLVNDIRKVVANCNHLAIIDEETQTVHFAHSSVKQYVLQHSIDQEMPSRPFIDKAEAEQYAGGVCITYLKLPDFEKQVVRPRQKSMGASAVTSAVIESLASESSTNRLALRLLRSTGDGYDMPLDELLNHGETAIRPVDHHFWAYATHFWLWHTKRIGGIESERLRQLWIALLSDIDENPDRLSGVPWTFNDLNSGSRAVAEWIVDANHLELANVVLRKDDSANARARYLFYIATSRANLEIMDKCLASGLVSPEDLGNGLILVSMLGSVDGAQRLLKAGASPLRELDPGLWLHCSETSNPTITDTMIEYVMANSGKCHEEYTGRKFARQYTPSGIMRRYGRQVLTVQPKDLLLPLQERNNSTALLAAAYCGHREIVQILLRQRHVNVNYVNEAGNTAFSFAAYQGHNLIIQDLREAGAVEVKSIGLVAAGKYRYRRALEVKGQATNHVNTDKHNENGRPGQ